MDPITHGIIGLGIAAMSGETELISPLTIGAMVGAMSPDIDIVAKYKGNYEYLKRHRGETHSIFSAVGLSAGIAGILSFIFPEYSFLNILLWTVLGTLSHIFFDALNSYGVKPLLPFKKKKYVAGLIMLYDPFITILSIVMFFVDMDKNLKIAIGLGSLAIYIAYRYIVKKQMAEKISEEYLLNFDDKLYVLPNLTNFFKWDFIIETESEKIIGRINFINEKIVEIERFSNVENKLISDAYDTELGRYFDEFTSSINHVRILEKDDRIQLDFIDLRYYLRDSFMHHASFVYDSDEKLKKSVFRPYKYDKEILVYDGN